MKQYLFHVIAATTSIIASGFFSFYAEQDFQASKAVMQAMANAMNDIPMTVGDWQGENQEQDSRTMNVAGVHGALTRLYKHPNGSQVSIYLACGSWRNMTQHTPDRCYQAAGFDMEKFSEGGNHSRVLTVKPLDENAEQGGDDFVVGKFRKETSTNVQDIEVFWNWSPDGTKWHAPEGDPRVGLSNEPEWYKLYVIADSPRFEATGDIISDRPIYQFCQEFMPILKEKLAVVEDARAAEKRGESVAASSKKEATTDALNAGNESEAAANEPIAANATVSEPDAASATADFDSAAPAK